MINRQILFTFILLTLSQSIRSQVIDDFSDGNFTLNPAWSGDTSDFVITSTLQLRLSSSGSDTSVLATRAWTGPETEWSFWLKLSFNTSLNNYARIFLGADTSDLKQAKDAVFLQVGGSGDSLSLNRLRNGVMQSLYRLPMIRTSKSVNEIRIRILLNEAGEWQFLADSTGGRNFIKLGEYFDTVSFERDWTGLFCRYTSSNSSRIWFDELYLGPVRKDSIPPSVISVIFYDSTTIRIKFNDAIDSGCVSKISNYSLKNHPENIIKAFINKDKPCEIYLRINYSDNPFYSDTLIIRNISDISGNILIFSANFIAYRIPGPCIPGDLVINEVLFHPDQDGSRYIEVYNRSKKLIRLDRIFSTALSAGKDTVKSDVLCCEERYLNPEDYFVVTADPGKVCSRYFYHDSSRILLLSTFPSMNSDSGSVFIVSAESSAIIDGMHYDRNMHLKCLSDDEGISLEKLDPSFSSNEPSSWHSAAGTLGFGSPGCRNSQYAGESEDGIGFDLAADYFSPDNDGKDDILRITLVNLEKGSLLTIRIFTAEGNPVKTLAAPVLASEGASFIWDGTDESGNIVAIGMYVILAECINLTGGHSAKKAAVAVIKKL